MNRYEQFCATAHADHALVMIPLRLARAAARKASDASLAAAREARDARHARHEWEANSAVSSAEYAHSRRDLCEEYRAAWRVSSAQVLEDFKALPRSLRLEAYTLAESYCYGADEDVYEDGVMVDTLVTVWARALCGALTALHGEDYVSDEVRAAYGVGVEE